MVYMAHTVLFEMWIPRWRNVQNVLECCVSACVELAKLVTSRCFSTSTSIVCPGSRLLTRKGVVSVQTKTEEGGGRPTRSCFCGGFH